MSDHVLIDIKTCDLTVSEFLSKANHYVATHPEWEVFVDGDLYALVGRDR